VRTEDEASVDGDEDDEDFHFDYDKICAKRSNKTEIPLTSLPGLFQNFSRLLPLLERYE
jgi:hypothetical protein